MWGRGMSIHTGTQFAGGTARLTPRGDVAKAGEASDVGCAGYAAISGRTPSTSTSRRDGEVGGRDGWKEHLEREGASLLLPV